MLKKFFISIISVLVISASSASGLTSLKDKVYANELEVVKSAPGTSGIKNELKDKRLKQIFADVIKIKQGKIGEIISKFLSNTSQWVWIIDEDELPEDINGQTTLTSAGVLTLLDDYKLRSGTNLSVARTMIHEMVHAYLTLYFQYDPVNANKDYPAILSAWLESMNPDYNKIQHDEIERSFIDNIAFALDEYSVAAGLNNEDKYVYSDLAWGGLDFQNNNQLTADIKERIQNRLLAEQLNKRFGTEKPLAF